VPSSTIEISDVKAAMNSARKKSVMNSAPPGSVEKSFGIQMKVTPSLPAPKIVFCTSAASSVAPPAMAVCRSGKSASAAGLVAIELTSCGTTVNTVQNTIIPAQSETVLFAAGRMKALSAVSSLLRIYAA
jgi:hypothetical protein